MTNFITFIISNFTLTFFVVGLLCSLVDLSLRQKPLHKQQVIEALLS